MYASLTCPLGFISMYLPLQWNTSKSIDVNQVAKSNLEFCSTLDSVFALCLSLPVFVFWAIRIFMTTQKILIHCCSYGFVLFTRVGALIVATIYLQLIQNRYMIRSFTVLHCSHQHCVQPVATDVEVVGYL